MFGRDTADKSFGAQPGTMEHARAKVGAGFEFMQKLGVEYFCFHDVDLVPEAEDICGTNRRLDEITDYILDKMHQTGIKCLWGTANMFSNPRFMNGAGSTNSADVYCFAAAQVKKAPELTVKSGGKGYVFWGGREGYETLINTDILGMDTYALGLIKAAKLIEDGRIDEFVNAKYASFDSEIGKRITSGNATLEEPAAYAENMHKSALPSSGRHEYLNSIVNSVLF